MTRAWRNTFLLFLCLGAACDLRDRRGYTPLILASIDGDAARVAELIRSGADPNECAGGPGWTVTPLITAAGQDHVQVVRELLAAGADPDRECRYETPLELAVSNGSLASIEALIRGGANVTRTSETGWTYLMMAAVAAEPETVPLLVRAGCPLEAVRDDGETALMVAAGWDTSVTKALLAAGANVHARDKEGATPLIHALNGAIHSRTTMTSPGTWDPAIVQMLIDAGADPCVRDASGATLWSLASRSGRHRKGIERVLSGYATRCR